MKIQGHEGGHHHGRAAYVNQHARKGREMVGGGPLHLADDKAGDDIQKGNDNVRQCNIKAHENTEPL